jgi:hypothetical protein
MPRVNRSGLYSIRSSERTTDDVSDSLNGSEALDAGRVDHRYLTIPRHVQQSCWVVGCLSARELGLRPSSDGCALASTRRRSNQRYFGPNTSMATRPALTAQGQPA